MIRKALLINATALPEKSAFADNALNAFSSFLLSGLGGCWKQSEIARVNLTSVDEIRNPVGSMQEADYSLICVIGDGSEKLIGRPWPEVEFQIAHEASVTERDLNPGSKRCLQIFDCTSSPEHTFRHPIIAMDHSNTIKAQALYEESLSQSDFGLSKIFAYNKKPPSPTDHSLIWHLLKASLLWGEAQSGILSIKDAILQAQGLASSESDTLSINYNGRRLNHFPFSVKM